METGIFIHASPARVITAFTDLSMLHDWWDVKRGLVNPCAGGMYVLSWQITSQGFGYVTTGTIREYDPASHLIIDNLVYMNPEREILGPMQLTIRATAQKDGTECNICQEGYRQGGDWDWYFQAVNEAWPVVLARLKEYLETP